MALDLEAKKLLLRKIPHGLFICGVREDDEINGFTASWVTQGSFEPPLVVMAVRSEGSSHGIIKRTRLFSLNMLRADQKDLAAVFFKPQSAMGGR
ncbi:MAG TPA: flavin reductase family protein, partial [Prochlorococcaceae cyanobacterium Fu_MAG_134]|nr:flavin reductase family protein [Prochlorococcaceae cyanobacterium Fu_MAG_134]